MKILMRPFKWLFTKPNFRYRFMFSGIFSPTPDEIAFKHAMEFAAHTASGGDYLEFGVWKGRTFTRAYHIWNYVKNFGKSLVPMRFYAFDSFEGLPEIKGVDLSTNEFKAGEYACSEEEFKARLKSAGVDLARVTTVKGWYDQVLNSETKKHLPLKKAAIVLIDVDLYESAVSVLDFLTDYVVDGTVILFDDWFCFRGSAERGEQKAFHEWLAKHPDITASEYHRYNWKSNSFILHRAT